MVRVEVAPDVVYQEIDGQTVLLDLQSERYYGLDPVGSRMWCLLAELGDLSRVTEQLATEYEVEHPRLVEDLARLTRELAEAGLIVMK